MVNDHINRVIDGGCDLTKLDATAIAFLTSVDSYLASNDYYKYLVYWVDPYFGVKLDGSGFVSRAFCLGTTRLPRGGDYTPTTSNAWPSTSSNTSYSGTGFRGTRPALVNNANTAHGYFGNGIANNIQRKNEVTLIAAYQRPSGTGVATLFGMGQFASGMFLQQAAGSSGNVSFTMYSSNDPPAASNVSATAAFASATAAHVAAGVFNGSTMTTYLDGVPGTPIDASAFANPTLLNDNVLRGKYGSTSSTCVALVSGSQTGLQTLATRAYSMDNQGLFSIAALIVFEKGLPAQAITDITALYS